MANVRAQFTLRLPLEVHIKLQKIAQEQTRSLTNMIEYLARKEIQEYEKENGEIKLTDIDYSLE